ncbi:transcription factor BIM1 isoform X1 [Raphanus sativus]|uniref:Transcription factor BIM1 isoform X1 n=1 Tax=Raphanus sativus TaxID=3726 RepID=A0A6J0KCJ3_RAPSA|nr:transcription factor BIM1 isoform X1 [Raphanus sativus]XP_056846402.1 transcription factor BIM1 isoform X1 [Raphanus sativus]
MELPQPRPFKTQEFPTGRKPTHDFLSLCSHPPTLQPDPKPTTAPSPQGSHLKTHDFLQPLECVGAKEETSRIDTTRIASEKPPPPAPPPPLQHVLPGGIGTYTISPIPYFHNQQRIPKPELSPPMMFSAAAQQAGGGNERNVVEENSNSNSSSYAAAAAAASGFTLWDESGSGKKGQTRKENNAGERAGIRADDAATMGQWPVVERRSQSLTNTPLSGFSSRSSSQGSGLKSQSFMDMLRSAKGTSQDDDFDDEEDFVMKKESSSTSQIHRDLRVKAEARGGGNDQKLNTPRSKHSATEQRRRSKINDRFQMLRQLIPNSDQKRDKASFLLEVIEYIQFLQEKTSKYETPYQGWNHDPAKLLNWQRNNQHLVPEGTVAFAPKLEEEKNNIPIPVLATTPQGVVTDRPETLNRATPTTGTVPLSAQSNSFLSPVIAVNPVTHLHTRVAASETVEPSESSRSHTQPLKEEGDDEEVHAGNISISSVYSQGLVKTLREALENSGVDLTKASISVEIELAKQSSSFKDHELRGPVSRTGNDDDAKQSRKPKRLKTNNTS